MMSPRFRHRSSTLVLVLLACVASFAPAQQPAPGKAPGPAEGSPLAGKPYTGPVVPTPRGLDGKPDLSGFWRPLREPGKPGGNLGKDEPGFILPFTELGKRAQLYAQNHTVDPEAHCILGGIPRHLGSGLPFEILHSPQRFGTFYLYNTHRLVTIDASRRLPDDPEPLYFGHSIARWEGDVLVIETVGLKDSSRDRIWLDENGNPTSDATRVLERWSRPDYHHLRVDLTVTDPKYYTRPFTFSRTWVRGEPGQGGEEYACNEANRTAELIGPGAGPIGPDGNRGFGYEDALPEVPPGPEAFQ